jgi:hypothetical protein
MSENAKKRIAIVMARDKGLFDHCQRLSAGVIHRRLETHFPKHHYNLMSVKLYLLRLFEASLVQPGQHGGPPVYWLTPGGYEAAQEYWKIRDELGYTEPAVHSVADTAAGIVAASAKEFIPAAI